MTNEERLEFVRKVYQQGTVYLSAFSGDEYEVNNYRSISLIGSESIRHNDESYLYDNGRYAIITKFADSIAIKVESLDQLTFLDNWRGEKRYFDLDVIPCYVRPKSGLLYLGNACSDDTPITFEEFLTVTGQTFDGGTEEQKDQAEASPRYVEFVRDGFSFFTKGKIYPLNEYGECQSDSGEHLSSMKWPDDSRYLKPSTKEAYDMQNGVFVAPKDWYFQGTNESRNFQYYELRDATNVSMSCNNGYYSHPGPTFDNMNWEYWIDEPTGTEITFDQFKRYIYEPSLDKGNEAGKSTETCIQPTPQSNSDDHGAIMKECPFKAGDIVVNVKSNKEYIVESVPGMYEYDKKSFVNPKAGFTIRSSSSYWGWDHWHLYKLKIEEQPNANCHSEAAHKKQYAKNDIERPILINVPKI